MQKLIYLYSNLPYSYKACFTDKTIEGDGSLEKILDDICISNYSTYQGRLASVRSKYKYFRLPPLVISSVHRYVLLALMCKRVGVVWVNMDYLCDHQFEDGELLLNFANGDQLSLLTSIHHFTTQLGRYNMVKHDVAIKPNSCINR